MHAQRACDMRRWGAYFCGRNHFVRIIPPVPAAGASSIREGE
jgi:hypothetical protein